MKENDFTLKKKQEANSVPQKLWRMQTMQMIQCFSQLHMSKPNFCCIVWSNQQEALASTWTQMKQSPIFFKQNEAISILNGKLLKLVHQFIYLGSNISSTKSDVNIHIRLLLTGYQSYGNLITLIEFFEAVPMSVLLFGCTTWTLKKCSKKKLCECEISDTIKIPKTS